MPIVRNPRLRKANKMANSNLVGVISLTSEGKTTVHRVWQWSEQGLWWVFIGSSYGDAQVAAADACRRLGMPGLYRGVR